MTQNQKNIIKLIAKQQLANPEEKGIMQRDLLMLCVEGMLCTTQKALKEQLS